MIADILSILFVFLAGVPLSVLLGLKLFFKEKIKFDKKSLKILIVYASIFLVWQLFQTFLLIKLDEWIYWVRAVDPLILVYVIYGLAFLADYDEDQEKFKKFIRYSLSFSLLNAVIQITAYIFAPTFSYLSLAAVVILFWIVAQAFYKTYNKILMRYRVSYFIWIISVLIPFYPLRLFFLVHIAWLYFRKYRRIFVIHEKASQLLKTEKLTFESLMEELSGSIKDVSDLKVSLNAFLDKLLKAIEGKAGAVYLWDDKRECFYAEAVNGFFFPLVKSNSSVYTRMSSIHKTVLSTLITDENDLIYKTAIEKKAKHYPYARVTPEIGGQDIGKGTIQTLIISPILQGDNCLGVLVVENKEYERYYNESDFNIVKNFSFHAAMMINSANMLKEKQERQRVSHELSVGYRIQADLLPQTIPDIPGIRLTGSMMPAKEIGGDYYDFIDYAEDELGIVIGDVSGKGVPAGMVMTIVHSMLHSLYPYTDSPKDLLVAVNKSLSENISSAMFITLIFFVYNSKNKTMRYVGCGHEHILIYRRKEKYLEAIRAGGLALGMTDDVSMILKEKELKINPGDTIVLYTDGIVEAKAQNGDMYSFERLKEFVEKNNALEPENLRLSLIEDVKKFSKGEDQSDDITCLVIKFDEE